MQMGWCSVLSWAATLSLAFKAPEKIDDWMVIPFRAIVFTIIHFKMSMLISEYKDKSKIVMVVTGPRTLADYLAVQKTITGILDSRYCTCQMKRLERKAQQS
jgi:hypothetical protein